MTTVQIKFSQNVVDVMMPAPDGSEPVQGELSGLFDAAVMLSSLMDEAYSDYSSWSYQNNVVRFNFEDGAHLTYLNVQLADPNASNGTATASTRAFFAPDAINLIQSGQLQLSYSMVPTASGSQLVVTILPGTVLTAFQVSTHFPVSSEYYDPTFGNASFALDGSITLREGNLLSGTLSTITIGADKFLTAGRIEGTFQVSADVDAIAEGSAFSKVSGTMRTYSADFDDQSYLIIKDAAIFMSDTDTVDASFFADPSRFPGDDVFEIEMPGMLHQDILLAAGSGHDNITISGGGGKLDVAAGDGADRIAVLNGSHAIDGGAGIDVLILEGARNSYTLSKTTAGFTVQNAAGAVNVLNAVERISFGDTMVALDITGNGGQAYRLYQAAFNRTPDSAGLGFWIAALDQGSSLNAIAAGFVQSSEYQGAYGGVQTNRELVTRFYENILHRAPEQAGADFWTDALDRQAASIPEVLAAISESAENQAGLMPVIGTGFSYTPYG